MHDDGFRFCLLFILAAGVATVGFFGGRLVSEIKDVADAAVAAFNALTAAAEAVLAAFETGSTADQQAALDELKTATEAANTETAKLQAAVAPPPPTP